jgi:LuxR family maltose regulon positive regulatory protein
MAEHYHFVRVVSLESGAIQPLLQSLKTDEISEAFLKKIQNETRKMALLYPDYMHCDTMEIPKLTPHEQRILAMLCNGKNTEEIYKECGITYSGLKFHNRNIYRKLGVTSRAGAERTAVRLGIVHRKDEDFIRLVMEEEQTDIVDAGLRMAEFVIKYGEYLESSDECKIIPW